MKAGWSVLTQPFAAVGERAEFRKLWLGNLVSAFGTNLTNLALPLTAAVSLRASPVQMGALTAASLLPNLLFGLPAGVIVDRLPRRLIVVVADVGRALLLASIPAAALLGVLGMEQLYAVVFLAAVLDLFFDVAATSLVPLVLGRELLTDGNTALSLNNQVARVVGPSVGGVLVGVLSAPIAIALDAASFVVSAACLAAIRVAEPPARRALRAGWWAELIEGLGLVWRDPVLRSIAGASVLGQLGGAVQAPLVVLFMARELGLPPTTLGVVFAAAGLGAVPGSFLARPFAAWLGQGRAVAAGTTLCVVGMLLTPLAAGPRPVLLTTLVAAQLMFGIGVSIYAINQLTLRQLAVPNHLQGRTNATRRFLMFGAAPLGAVASGYLAEAVGLRPGLLVGALLMAAALLWTICSPLWSLRGNGD
jgi:MFS family permease